MKRRTFLQTIVGAVAAVFMPKIKEANAIRVPWIHLYTETPWTKKEVIQMNSPLK